MCVGIPMLLIKRDGSRGVVALGEVERDISLALMEEAEIGDYLIVHAGFAIERLDPQAAGETLELFRELAELAGDGE